MQKNHYLRCYIKRVAASQCLKQLYRAQTIGKVASGQFFWMHSGFEVACGFEAARASTHRLRSGFGEATLPIRACSGFEVASEQPFRAHSGFKVASEQPFEHIVASKCFQSNHFERIVASKWLKWLLCVASEQPFRAHSGFEVASEQPFRAHCGFEVAQVAPVREIAMFLRRHVATKPRDPRNPQSPKRNY